MPYPNEHAARLKAPGKYVRFRRENDKFGKGIHVIWGVTKEEKTELQSIRFDSKKFTVKEAKAWLKDHDYKPILFEPASGKKEARSFRGAVSGAIREAKFEDRDYLVVPVVALVEGVIHPVNSEDPELVLAEEFSKVPEGWNGEPVTWDHPSLNGKKVSANEPLVLERMAFGQLFHTKVKKNKLATEAWLDLEKAGQLEEAGKVIARLRAAETVEVSVGVFVETEEQSGERDGKKYSGIWRNIVPDHLALLPEGTIGACDVGMGCGAPRAAEKRKEVVIVKTRLERMRVMLSHPEVAQGNGVISAMMSTCDESFASLETSAEKGDLQDPSKPWYLRLLGTILGSQEGQSDQDLRNALNAALNAVEPGYLGIDAVFQKDGLVVYAVAPEDAVILYRRGFTTKEDGAVTLADKKEEVHLVRKYEPVVAASGRGDGSITKPVKEKEMDKKKKADRIAAIVASGKTCFKAEDANFMGEFSEERLTDLEQHIEKVKVAEADAKKKEDEAKTAEADAKVVAADAKAAEAKVAAEKAAAEAKAKAKAAAEKAAADARTPEQEEAEFLAKHPALGKIVTDAKAAETAKKTDLVTRLKDATKAGYTEEQLKAMEVPQLEQLAAIILKPKVDFSGAGGPRQTESDGDVPKPIDMAARIIAARQKKSA